MSSYAMFMQVHARNPLNVGFSCDMVVHFETAQQTSVVVMSTGIMLNK